MESAGEDSVGEAHAVPPNLHVNIQPALPIIEGPEFGSPIPYFVRACDAAMVRYPPAEGGATREFVASTVPIETTFPGTKLGSQHRLTMGSVGIGFFEVKDMRPRRYGRRRKGTPRRCPVGHKRWQDGYYEASTCQLSIALMRAKELADWLRATRQLP